MSEDKYKRVEAAIRDTNLSISILSESVSILCTRIKDLEQLARRVMELEKQLDDQVREISIDIKTMDENS